MANSRQSAPSPCFRSRPPRNPKELATRCYKLACKKLEVDEKKHVYDVRERLLLYVTLNKAEKMIEAAKEPRMPWDDAEDECTIVVKRADKMTFTPLERFPSAVPIKAGTSTTAIVKKV